MMLSVKEKIIIQNVIEYYNNLMICKSIKEDVYKFYEDLINKIDLNDEKDIILQKLSDLYNFLHEHEIIPKSIRYPGPTKAYRELFM